MRLRSITKHVKDQNWFAVFLDFFIVVAGILIAFQITNWNESRSERADERGILVALNADMEQSKTDLDSMIEKAERGQAHLRKMTEFADGQHDDLASPDIDESILLGLYSVYYFTPTTTTYDELVNSGRLSIVAHTELKAELKKLKGAINSFENEEASIEKMSYDTMDPFLLLNTDFRGFVSVPSATHNDIRLNWVDPLKDRRDPKPAFRNPEALNILLYRGRLNMTLISLAEDVREHLIETQKLIQQRLTELGVQ